MAAGRRRHRRGSGNPAVWAGRGHAGPPAAGRAELGGPGARAETSWRHDVDPLGGIPRDPFRGLRLQPLLRPSTWIRTSADPRDASAPRRRGEGLRRLFGQADRDRRSDDGRDPRGGDFRRRARRLKPHLRRGDLDADVAGLDRRACSHVPIFRRRAEAAGSRQSEERRQQGLLLRSGDQPDLRGHGSALLGRRPAGAAGKAAGQGKGRGRGQIRPDLHSGAAARADLLLARRMQRGDRARHEPHERSSHAQSRPEPTGAVREDRARRPHRLAR